MRYVRIIVSSGYCTHSSHTVNSSQFTESCLEGMRKQQEQKRAVGRGNVSTSFCSQDTITNSYVCTCQFHRTKRDYASYASHASHSGYSAASPRAAAAAAKKRKKQHATARPTTPKPVQVQQVQLILRRHPEVSLSTLLTPCPALSVSSLPSLSFLRRMRA